MSGYSVTSLVFYFDFDGGGLAGCFYMGNLGLLQFKCEILEMNYIFDFFIYKRCGIAFKPFNDLIYQLFSQVLNLINCDLFDN